jgi:hypothetical protein
LAGLEKIGWLPSTMSAFGLALLRRRGKAAQGAALLASAAGLAFITRKEP